jgi:hypothetical protein
VPNIDSPVPPVNRIDPVVVAHHLQLAFLIKGSEIMTNNITGWDDVNQNDQQNQEVDPYDNYADVRAGFNRQQAAPHQSSSASSLTNFVENTQINQIDDELSQMDRQFIQEVNQSTVMGEAQARIETANLYQTILNHQLFAEGSARPEIMAKVEGEMKAFALERLEILLGMKNESRQNPVQVELPFSQEEIEMLKTVAGRFLSQKQPSPPTPQIKMVNAVPQQHIQPQMRPVAVKTQSAVQPKQQVRQPAPVQQPRQEAPKPKGKRAARSQATPASVTGVNLPKPLAMPDQSTIDVINAQEAAKNSKGGSQLMDNAIKISIAKNANVREE